MGRDPVRRCTTCSLLGKEPVPEATMVMENAEGLQWFECDYHDDPEDHPDGPWVKRVALPRFFRQVELMANDLNSEQQLEELRSKFDRAREALLYAPEWRRHHGDGW